MQTTFRLFAMLVLLAVAATCGCDSQSPVGEEHADVVAGDVADLDALADTDSEGDDADSTAPDDAITPDDAIASDTDGHSELDLELDTEQTTPIADGWCWLAGPPDARQVVCEDGSYTELPVSCAGYDVSPVSFDERIDLYVFATLGCTRIPGAVRITFNDRLTTLKGLDRLEEIGGSLIVQDELTMLSNVPVSLKGLDGLETIGGGLYVGFTRLETLAGLGRLRSVGGNLTVTLNPTLKSLQGLDSLTTVAGTLEVSNCPQLQDLRGLERLEHVGGHLTLIQNDLESLAGLDALTTVGGGLGVRGATGSLAGAPQLRALAYLSIELAAGLESLDGLQLDRLAIPEVWPGDEDPPPVAPSLNLHGNPDLRDISALGSIQVPTHLTFLDLNANPALTSLDGLQFVTSVGDGDGDPERTDLSISSNDALTSLQGLDALDQVGTAHITHNAGLTRLWTHGGLSSIDHLEIQTNASLTSLGDLLRTSSGVLETLTLRGNDSLPDLNGLSGVTEVETLHIEDNAALGSLSGLDDVIALGQVDIRDNASLATLAGLEQVQTLDRLDLEGNPGLSTLTGLSGLQEAGDITLRDIPLVTTLTGLDNLRVVDRLALHSGSLTDLQGLSGADLIGELYLDDLDTMTTLAGLGQGNAKIGELRLEGLDALTSGTDQTVWIVGRVDVTSSPLLTDLGALGALDLAYAVSLTDVPMLTVLPDMNDVDTMYSPGGVLLENTGLTHLDALANLRELWGQIDIRNNAQLQDVSGLSSLEHVHEAFVIVDNPLVPQCQAEALAANLWVNGVTISGNDSTATCP